MSTDIVATNLRLEHGVSPSEFDHVVKVLGKLDHRLRSFEDRSIELSLHVKERDTPSQHTTLEASIPGRPRFVATSSLTDFDLALAEVRDDMVRLLTDAKTISEPRNNRALRDQI